MKSIIDYTIYNSVNPDALSPAPKKAMPFPLENFDEEIGVCYQHIDRIITKLQAAQQNPVNDTPARQKRLKSLLYKANASKEFIKEISSSCSELWF